MKKTFELSASMEEKDTLILAQQEEIERLNARYRETRQADWPKEILHDYKGYLQTDGYKGYDWVDEKSDIIHFNLRLEKARPILDEMRTWLTESLRHAVPQSKLSNALIYMHDRWHELTNYLANGELEIDNNGAENQIRPFAPMALT